MSKQPPPQAADGTFTRKQAPEDEWLCICVRKQPGSYHRPGGWELRVGYIPEGRVPADQRYEPNVLGVVMGHIEGVIATHRETRAG